MRLVVEGLDEAQAWLDAMSERAASAAEWTKTLDAIGEASRRVAVSISPVVTGSYAGSHRVVASGMTVELSINPLARNGKTPVTAYAGAVERRHQVYGRTAAALPGIIEREGAALLERIAK